MKKLVLLFGLTINYYCTQSIEFNESAHTNFIVIFADDLGYGDLGSYGHPSIKTPNLDQMAIEGQRWTNFYAGASVCTPSRAAILTGRLPIRSGMTSHKNRVLFPNSKNGIPETEITLAEQLKKVGYTTACIGKWHLGHKKKFLPTQNGFDYYYGIPYSNDMDLLLEKTSSSNYRSFWKNPKDIKIENFNVPLMRNNEIIERPANQKIITKRYTEESIKFIKTHKEKPFFIYLAHSLPHVPLFASDDFINTSQRGLYGDVIEEIDYGVGQIINTLKEEGLDKNTIVVFTSDNGPWLIFKENGGSAGILKAGKGTTWEGGMREPAIFWSPGKIKPGVISELGSTMDLFTTFSAISKASLPKDRIIDGKDLSNTLFKHEKSPRKQIIYYRGNEIYAVRNGAYKAHYITEGEYEQFGKKKEHNPPLLYNLNIDPSEQYEISEKHPKIIFQINLLKQKHYKNLVRGENQLEEREDNVIF